VFQPKWNFIKFPNKHTITTIQHLLLKRFTLTCKIIFVTQFNYVNVGLTILDDPKTQEVSLNITHSYFTYEHNQSCII